MRSRTVSGVSTASLMGLAVGVVAGLTAGLLAAPVRGNVMRARLRTRAHDGSVRLQSLASSSRDWASHTVDRALSLIEQGRRALRTGAAEPESLHATVGEIASMHGGSQPTNYGVTS